MSTHNICFLGEISKISILFGLKKKKSILVRAMSCVASGKTINLKVVIIRTSAVRYF